MNKLLKLEEIIAADVNRLLDYFSLDLYYNGKTYSGKCPLRIYADNVSAFNIYPVNDVFRWVDYSHHTEKYFYNTMVGLCRGLLSFAEGWRKEGDRRYSFSKTLKFLGGLYKLNACEMEYSRDDLEKKDS